MAGTPWIPQMVGGLGLPDFSGNLIGQSVYEIAALDYQDRLIRMRRAWQCYHGQFPDVLEPIRQRDGRPLNDNVKLNWLRPVVDKGISFLFGQGVEFQIGDDSSVTPDETYLAEVWRANKKRLVLKLLAFNGAIAGHTFVRILPVGDPANPLATPRLIALDPANVMPIYDPNDLENELAYVHQYTVVDPLEKVVTYRQMIERDPGGLSWTIRDQKSAGGGGFADYQPPTHWPWPFAPIAGCQNLTVANEYFGISDLEPDLIDLNESLNLDFSNLQRILRRSAAPKLWGRGFAAKDVQVGLNDMLVLTSPTAEIQQIEMTGDMMAAITVIREKRLAFHAMARVPEVSIGKLDTIGNISGIALQILYQPLVEKTNDKRDTYGEFLLDLNNRLLQMGGFALAEDMQIDWPEMLPGDPQGEAATYMVHKQLGVSSRTILRKLGYNPDKEEALSAQEAETALKQQQALFAATAGQQPAASGQAQPIPPDTAAPPA